MSVNISGFDETQYLAISSTISVSLFFFTVLPALILCLLCVMGLFYATELNPKLRVLLVNLFAVEIIGWLGDAVIYLLFPVRAAFKDEFVTCHISYFLILASASGKYPAAVLYSVKAFIFIKYGERKLKWYILIPSIVIWWTISIVGIGSLPLFVSQFGIFNSNGFCGVNSVLLRTVSLYLILIGVVSLCVIIICCILTFVHIKKSVLVDSAEIKKATAKVLFYLSITSVLVFISSVLPVANPLIREALEKRSVVGVIAVNYLLRVIYNVPPFLFPIVSLGVLKPVRVAMKKKLMKVLCFFRERAARGQSNSEMATVLKTTESTV